jgi:hypothetical protein
MRASKERTIVALKASREQVQKRSLWGARARRGATQPSADGV